MTLVDLLVSLQAAKSRSEARRLINQGAVQVGGKLIAWDGEVAPGKHTIQIGKSRTFTVEFSNDH